MLHRVLSSIAPVTLPMQALGSSPIVWLDTRLPVWAWISWPHTAAERLPGFALAMNDLGVCVEIQPTIYTRWQPWVWRTAVTHRAVDDDQATSVTP